MADAVSHTYVRATSVLILTQFRGGISDQRSNISTRVRRTAGLQIFDCTAQYLLTSRSRKDAFWGQIGWIPDESIAGGGKYNPWVVEILDFHGAFDIDTVFLNPKLHLVFGAIVHGVSAVPLLKAGKSPTVHVETNDQIWGLQHTTPGDIASSAIAARFTLSADDSLRKNGTATGINWAADHEIRIMTMYVKYLTVGIEKRKASVLKIF
ncbi:hypothetical protein C8R44DRAFT_604498 [Mycena epipterygia]|nr:hypothetical protein C8R44DRAFT_604498 [Mycena epipterygia]